MPDATHEDAPRDAPPAPVLRVNTLGTTDRQRMFLEDRRHQGFMDYTGCAAHPLALFNSIRGTCLAALAAHAEGDEKTLRLALVRNQRLVARLIETHVPRPSDAPPWAVVERNSPTDLTDL